MTTADVLLLDYDAEISNTRRTLERVPADKASWSPHPRSMPMGKLAMHCATMPLFGVYVLEDEGMDLAAPTRPHASLVYTTPEALLESLAANATACRAALVASTDQALQQEWPFTFGEQTIFRAPRASAFRTMCFDHLIHHTAQLGVYLRLLDLPVPALYGPSADEPWQPS